MTTLTLSQLSDYCGILLDCNAFDDYAPNGVQVEAGEEISRLVTGVSASLELIEAAADGGADAILVHHGYFWKGEPPSLTGLKGRRIRALLENHISLLAYHLPLDAHPEYGNNIQLARRLGFGSAEPLSGGMIWRGMLAQSCSAEEFGRRIAGRLGRVPLHIGDAGDPIRDIAWCTGAAQDFIEQAAGAGVDAYLTGEVSERTVLAARELGLHFFAAGHHATERYGVAALGEHLAAHFGIEVNFIDIPNPA
ncbi:MAG TPA: Nif3-like dinuclear metal center hexameric protein [Chromatiales bacterium]|nr:Nif3-like dinuclear metal center hexameric protein [Chromatiales bacterium]